jgi:flagellar protein FlbD
MIHVTRLAGSDVVVNAGHLLMVEHTPDSVLVLTNGYRLMVREPVEEIVRRVEALRRRVFTHAALAEPLPRPTTDDSQPADCASVIDSES